MNSEQDYRPKSGVSNPRDRPGDWLSANQAVMLAEKSVSDRINPWDLAKRAAAGNLRTWAALLVVGDTRWVEVQLPSLFWADFGPGMEQDWETGNFSITVKRRFQVSAVGVVFHRGDLGEIFPKTFGVPPKTAPPIPSAPTPRSDRAASHRTPGGRKMSASWPQWVAELVVHIHENGIPEGDRRSPHQRRDGCLRALPRRGDPRSPLQGVPTATPIIYALIFNRWSSPQGARQDCRSHRRHPPPSAKRGAKSRAAAPGPWPPRRSFTDCYCSLRSRR
jgi:hypothetical protein